MSLVTTRRCDDVIRSRNWARREVEASDGITLHTNN